VRRMTNAIPDRTRDGRRRARSSLKVSEHRSFDTQVKA